VPKASVLVGRLPAKRGLEVAAKRYEPPLEGDEVVVAGARVMDKCTPAHARHSIPMVLIICTPPRIQSLISGIRATLLESSCFQVMAGSGTNGRHHILPCILFSKAQVLYRLHHCHTEHPLSLALGRRSFLLVLLMVGLIGTATLAFLLRTGPPSRSCSALDAERRSEMATRRVGVQQIAFSLLPFVLTAGADVAAAVVRPLSCVSYYSRISS